MKDADKNKLVDAVQDLARILLMLNEASFASKSETIRRLTDYSIPPSRIALLLGMKPKDVTSTLSKAKKVGK